MTQINLYTSSIKYNRSNILVKKTNNRLTQFHNVSNLAGTVLNI